ncbi:MAG TPA: DUF4389 domain-containing protein [Thermoleophilia bacterium]|nr:DUF4389 domain-containing protein [Thermoleophilia bacterium]
MARPPYPVRVRIDYNPRSSRVWAILTMTLVKFVALFPHLVALVVLSILTLVAFFAAQVMVLVRGTYPRPLFAFVTGVLRWQTRVYAFALSLTDVYPPFSLEPIPDYPVDLEIEYPERSSPWLASLTIAALIFWLSVILPLGWGAYGAVPQLQFQPLDNLTNVRFLALLPHYVVLFFFFLAALIVFAVGQLMILVGGGLPPGMHAFIAGWLRWTVRVSAWLWGLVDAYPPFTTEEARPER